MGDEKQITEDKAPAEIMKSLHKTIKKVTEDTATLNFNTAISQMMVYINDLSRLESLPREAWEPFVLLLAPYAPHLAEELWAKAGHGPSVANVSWPKYVVEMTLDDEIQIVCQINGKVRAKLMLPRNASKEDIIAAAKANDNVMKYLENAQIVKEIVVPGKLVSFVVK